MKTLLISKCLLGENVRYDGGNCLLRSDYLSRLKHHYKLVPICPELMAGFTIPREPIERSGGKIISKSGKDVTAQFNDTLESIKALVIEHNVNRALLKDFSPSCGVNMIYDGSFSGEKIKGQGLITEVLTSLGVNVFGEDEIEQLL